MKVPAAAVDAMRMGLRLVAAGLQGRGLRPETVSEARDVVRRGWATRDKVDRMRGWLARHGASPDEVAARRRQAAGDAGAVALGAPPSERRRAPALTSWLLWGGDAARRWLLD